MKRCRARRRRTGAVRAFGEYDLLLALLSGASSLLSPAQAM